MVTGDFVRHGLASKDPTKFNWPPIKETIMDVMNLIKHYLPDIPILPNIGNNDVLNHY
jgi:hypothetical protein